MDYEVPEVPPNHAIHPTEGFEGFTGTHFSGFLGRPQFIHGDVSVVSVNKTAISPIGSVESGKPGFALTLT